MGTFQILRIIVLLYRLCRSMFVGWTYPCSTLDPRLSQHGSFRFRIQNFDNFHLPEVVRFSREQTWCDCCLSILLTLPLRLQDPLFQFIHPKKRRRLCPLHCLEFLFPPSVLMLFNLCKFLFSMSAFPQFKLGIQTWPRTTAKHMEFRFLRDTRLDESF